MKSKGGEPYRIERRTKKKKGSHGPLSGFALDITIRANGEGAYFLEDHNSDRNAMPQGKRDELEGFLLQELARNHIEHFGHP